MIVREISEADYSAFHGGGESLPVFHRLEWVNAVSSAYPVQKKLLGIFRDNSLIAAFPVYIRQVLGCIRLAGSPLAQIATPSTVPVMRDSSIIDVKDMIVAIKKWQRVEKIAYFQMVLSMEFLPRIREMKLQYEIIDNLEISLENSIETLWKNIKRKSRLQDAVKRGVKVHWIGPHNAFNEYKELLRSTYDQGQQIDPNFTIKFYENLIKNLHGSGLKLLAATYKGAFVSMLWILYDKKKAYFWDGASDQKISRELDVNRLLHWEVMRWAQHQGRIAYDLLGRSERSGRSGLRPGIARFKKTLGPERIDYIQLKMSSAWVRLGIFLYRKLLSIRNKPRMKQDPSDD